MSVTRLGLFVVLLAAVGASNSGCSKKQSKPEYHYAFNASGFENVELTVNGQPVPVSILTGWIIDGPNTIEVRASRGDEHASKPFELWLVRYKSLVDSEATTLWTKSSADPPADKVAEIKETIHFDASVPFQRTWQTADDVGKLSPDDEKQVLALFARVRNAAVDKQSSFKDIADLFVGFGPGREVPPESMKLVEETMSKVRGYNDLTIETVPADQMRLVAGTKVVRLEAKNGQRLFYVGHKPDYKAPVGEVTWSMGLETYFFCKLQGRWFLLSQ